MKTQRHIYTLTVCIALLGACREKYVPKLNEVATGYLVVDGFINSGAGATAIALSRTTTVSSAAKIVRETKATVRVEAKNTTTVFNLVENSAGIYSHPQLSLNSSDSYRLNITTSDGKKYVSDYSVVRRMPDIDSISWKVVSDGLDVGANTHDDLTPVGYYQFKFDETWELRSAYENKLKMYLTGPGYIDSINFQPDWSIFYCWKFDTSYNTIRIYSTEKLIRNQVAFYPLVHIPYLHEKLAVRYSLFLRSYVLSKQGYRYLEQMKKNTELLGSIFDPQPTDNAGNLQCVSHPGERVLGFVEVSEEKTKRVFISNQQLKDWNYTTGCGQVSYKYPSAEFNSAGRDSMMTDVALLQGVKIEEVFFAPKYCVDCRLRGGINKKPSFW